MNGPITILLHQLYKACLLNQKELIPRIKQNSTSTATDNSIPNWHKAQFDITAYSIPTDLTYYKRLRVLHRCVYTLHNVHRRATPPMLARKSCVFKVIYCSCPLVDMSLHLYKQCFQNRERYTFYYQTLPLSLHK